MAVASRSSKRTKGNRGRARSLHGGQPAPVVVRAKKSSRPQSIIARLNGAGMGASPADVLAMQQTVGNRAVQRHLIQREEVGGDGAGAGNQTETRSDEGSAEKKKELKSKTGFVGLNPKAWKEAEALKKSAEGEVIVSLDSPSAEKGFSTVEKRVAWVMNEIGVNPLFEFKRFMTVFNALESASPAFREQMGDMMKMFNGAEKGEYKLERLVMSGHSNGVELWGDKEGKGNPGKFMVEKDFTNLVKAFPKAASQVEDVMFSACFSVGAILLCQKLFPNLQAAWAYSKFSPSVNQGSGRHISKFEKTTRGESTPTARAKSGSSAIWTRDGGFVVGDPGKAAIKNLTNRLNARVGEISKMLKGEAALNQSILREYYTIIQDLIVHPDCDSGLKKKAEEIRDDVLRLRFWKLICTKFVEAYKAEMDAAYAEIGLKPRIKGISRIALKAHIAEYEKALEDKPSSKAQLFLDNKLRKGLWELDSSVIPTEWI